MMARIVRIHEYGDASVLKLEDLEVSAPAANEVQISVKAIGLNRAEVMFRNHAYLQEAEFPQPLRLRGRRHRNGSWERRNRDHDW